MLFTNVNVISIEKTNMQKHGRCS